MAEEEAQNQTSGIVNSSGSFLFIKVHLDSSKSNVFGVMLIKINCDVKHLELVEVAVSNHAHFIQDIPLQSSWAEYLEFVNRKKLSSEVQSSLSKDIIDHISNLLSGPTGDTATIDELMTYHNNNESSRIAEVFAPTIGRLAFDRNIRIQVD